MAKIHRKIKVSVKNNKDTETRKRLEISLDIDKKLFQGTEWLEKLNRIESLGEYLKKESVNAVIKYIKSAEDHLIDLSKIEEKKSKNQKIEVKKTSNLSVAN